MTKAFIRKILNKEKKLLKINEVNFTKLSIVEHVKETSFKYLLKLIENDPEMTC